ncbi:carboxypeptidase inhibitor SmCI-like [Alosa pseudoharengus]|uniref:carboxypeptidase inhibitor SmCI-like n=1 Tax=Alosa pseudoharengus TaxID=34774 RepID=UPI003F88B798
MEAYKGAYGPFQQDQCLALMDRGPCRALIPRWYHNAVTNKCEQFMYGGCHGNRNNYRSKKECTDTCKCASDQCLALMDRGPCRALIPRWYHNAVTNKCEQFMYGGCHGNRNNYRSKKECTDTCKCASDQCLALMDRGPCHALIPRWYHNAVTNKCERFMYGGCHGNRNNYRSKKECTDTCLSALQQKILKDVNKN